MEGRVAKGRGGELTGRQDDKAGFCSPLGNENRLSQLHLHNACNHMLQTPRLQVIVGVAVRSAGSCNST